MKEKKVSIAVVQMSSSENKVENGTKSIRLMDSIVLRKPDIIVFPEYNMISTDYSKWQYIRENAESCDGKFVESFIKYASKNRVNILCNIAESEFGVPRPYNTSVLINSDGYISGKYRKLHLFDALGKSESSAYTMGFAPPVPFSLGDFSIGAQICYDLRFPEAARLLAVQGAKIIIYQAGWFRGERKLDQWRTLLRSRAIENGIYIVASAQCGEKFTGHSMIISPYGDVVAEAGEEETVLVNEIDLSTIEKYLSEVPVLKARRLDIYDVKGR
ncbi:MAG: carbon-nitrogen hydrolase family protein [Thermoplasmataceae archaeon]